MKFILALLVAPIIISLVVLQSVTFFIAKAVTALDQKIYKILDKVL